MTSTTIGTKRKIEPDPISFDDDEIQVTEGQRLVGQWHDFSYMIYSFEGAGKSTFTESIADHLGLDAVLALDIEGKLYKRQIRHLTVPRLEKYAEEDHYKRLYAWWDYVIDRAERRAAPFNEYSRVIVVDTLNTLLDKFLNADLARRYITGDAKLKSKEREDWFYDWRWYNPMYANVLKRIRRMMNLSSQYGYSVLFNAHVEIEKVKLEGSDEEYDKIVAQLKPALAKVINKEIDEMFYIQKNPKGYNYFITGSNDAYPIKDQSGMFPRAFPCTWAAIEAIQLGQEYKHLTPRVKVEVKKEEKK